MKEFLEGLFEYLYENRCPGEVGLVGYTEEQGCGKELWGTDLQLCRNCWQSALIKYEESKSKH